MIDYQFNQGKNKWIVVEGKESASISHLQEHFGLNDEVLRYSLDKNERARVEYDPLADHFLLVFNVPKQEKSENHFKTSPITFLIKDNFLFTIVNDDTKYLVPTMKKMLLEDKEQSTFSFLFHILFVISDSYFPLIEEVNHDRLLLNERLREKTTNQHLLELSDLDIGLVYFVTATKQNVVLLEQLKAIELFKKMTPKEKEELDDALIEANQAFEMTKLASEIISQLQGTYNNLLNNNLNDTMKFLTVWSLLLTIPTIVTGFYGMNLNLPFTEFGWVVTLVISLVLTIGMVIALWRKIK